jgi:hypothetical protein
MSHHVSNYKKKKKESLRKSKNYNQNLKSNKMSKKERRFNFHQRKSNRLNKWISFCKIKNKVKFS